MKTAASRPCAGTSTPSPVSSTSILGKTRAMEVTESPPCVAGYTESTSSSTTALEVSVRQTNTSESSSWRAKSVAVCCNCCSLFHREKETHPQLRRKLGLRNFSCFCASSRRSCWYCWRFNGLNQILLVNQVVQQGIDGKT